jgi:DNA-binding transcriptional MerR regulator
MASQASRKHASDTSVIPDRLYFKIGDVARICGLETYVLRFWESQFPQLKPNKSGTGQRLYRRRDVEMVLEIKRLVHKEGYTIPGARQALETAPSRRENQPEPRAVPGAQRSESVRAAIGQARAELRAIADMLGSAPAARQVVRARVVKTRPSSESLFPL